MNTEIHNQNNRPTDATCLNGVVEKPLVAAANLVMEEEFWMPIKGYEGMYSVSTLGNVMSFRKNQCGALRAVLSFSNNYTFVILYGSVVKTQMIHRLVAMAFIPNPQNKPFVNHKNGVRNDNRVENLEWCTHEENMRHARNELKSFGENQHSAKLTMDKVREIRANYPSKTLKQLADEYGVCFSNISKIVRNITWKED